MSNVELYHHGIKGQKWGVRRFQNKDGTYTPAGKKRYNSDSGSGGGIAGAIRRKQRANAQNDLDKVRAQKRQVDSELRELRGYEKNPSALGKSKLSTAIRRSQIKSLEKTKAALKEQEKENLDVLKELDDIEKYQADKHSTKAAAPERKFKVSKTAAKNAADKALDKLDDYLFFNDDKIPNNFAVRAGIKEVRDGLNSGRGIYDTAVSAVDAYKFFRD